MASRYLPSLQQVSRETLAVLAAPLLAAWVINRWPAARELVRGSAVPGPFDS